MYINASSLNLDSLIMSATSHTILMTLLPSTKPFRLFAETFPSVLRASSSSHQPKRKSRAISLNHGVKEFPVIIVSAVTRPGLGNELTFLCEHRLQLCLVYILVVANLIVIGCDINIGSYEEDIINCRRCASIRHQTRFVNKLLPSCSPQSPFDGAK